jgi:hypothetical protein
VKIFNNEFLALFLFGIFSSWSSSSYSIKLNFELRNKANYTISVMRRNSTDLEDSTSVPRVILGPGQEWRDFVQDDKPILITIRNFNALKEAKKGENVKVAAYSALIIATERTKFLSFDPKKFTVIYPQTGKLWGLLGTTESGLSLENNVVQSDIKETSMVIPY